MLANKFVISRSCFVINYRMTNAINLLITIIGRVCLSKSPYYKVLLQDCLKIAFLIEHSFTLSSAFVVKSTKKFGTSSYGRNNETLICIKMTVIALVVVVLVNI